jgi:negative regulator of sigma E activity
MTEQRRFGESDHERLEQDDILARAIGGWREEMPSRDLWPGIAAQIQQQPVAKTRQFAFTLSQLAMAASLLIAVASGLTYLAITRTPVNTTAAAANGPVIQAYGLPDDQAGGQIVQANFADAQFNAAVSDLEKVLHDDRDRLDARTVQIIERNLKVIDAAINEARTALNEDPANPYLNSHLADARRRKLDLLRQATSLASAGGD